MAIAFLFEAEGVTGEQYDAVMKGINRESVDSPYPEGVIAHVSGPSEDGWRVVDVWESQAAAEQFYGSETFRAGTAHLPPLEPKAFPLHRLEVYENVRQVY